MERMPDFYRDIPRTPSAEIEGKRERPFTEIDPGQMQPVPLRDIEWKNAALRFQEVGSILIPRGPFGMDMPALLYTGQLEIGKGKKRTVNLTKLVENKPILFTGTGNGFFAYDPELVGRGDDLFAVGVQPDELEADMSKLSAVYHELGHVFICDGDLETQIVQAGISLSKKDLPPVRNARGFANVVAHGIPESLRVSRLRIHRKNLSRLEASNGAVSNGVSLFHERNAWAGGMRLARRLGLPTGFKNPESYFEYARLCLSTYADSRRDQRYVNGFRKAA